MANNTAIIFVGSVDGILTASALLNHLHLLDDEYTLHPTQAFTCMQTVPDVPGNSEVWLVDLAVNNRDPDYTKKFLTDLYNKNCVLKGIVDEHDAAAWISILPDPSISLEVYPVSQVNTPELNSSGAVLLRGNALSYYGTGLCLAAHLADNGVFRGVGDLVNRAVKADIKNQHRRKEIVQILANEDGEISPIEEWAREYNILETNMEDILSKAQVLDEGIVVADSRGVKVDMTSLMFKLYERAPYCMLRGQAWNGQEMANVVSFGTSTETNMQSAIGLNGFGFAKKWNVADSVAMEALDNLKEYLQA